MIYQLDFHCEPDYKVGLFGGFFLSGIVIGCVTLARMGDLYGRKKVYVFGLCVQLLITLGILVSSSAILDYVLLLVLGWAMSGKQYVGYNYLIEF